MLPGSHAPKAALTMATNFFQQQDSARRKTFRLVVYFLLAILILITYSDYSTRGWTYQAQPWTHTKSAGSGR